MAAAGIALATIFADIPVRVTEMSPSQITVGTGILIAAAYWSFSRHT